ncbi:MAG TPA: branched-chain amino acid ABC transporter permease [Bacillota bacterium]|jgi:branched-chain amino acid transport system permease protein|nr:branched-chain amino acid ABC transporter permease [Fastidiosipila sp.]HPX92747.1 branched-chain amino acid ABC transporter permease [Bacillota bacterium]HQB80644.1 branched-chain amino acid ABC transporter permease [Bacillota bacterium]
MSQFLQQLINGLSIGSIYALMAVGYSLVYSIMNFSNFAHGGVIMLSSYIGYYANTLLNVSFAGAIIIATLAATLIASVIERLAYRPLRKRTAPTLYFIISAMGMSILLENLVIATIGPQFKTYPMIFEKTTFQLGSLSISKMDVLMLAISSLALIGLVLFLNKTRAGMAVRAATYNARASQLMGVNVDRIIMTVFALGGALAGIAGVFFGIKYTVYAQAGIITNKAFIAAVFGGLGSLPGAIVGSILLGVIETFVAAVRSQLRDLIAFVILIGVLVVKPTGIMGKHTEDKA